MHDGANAPANTRSKIKAEAEQLFAVEGFDRVTLRQIARASHQKNVAAVQYHFGSKEGLLATIVEEHRAQIDEARRHLLDQSEAEGRGENLSRLVEILVAPLVGKLDSASGRAYLRIQAQGLSNETMRPATQTVIERIGQNLRKGLGSLEGGQRNRHQSRFALLLLLHALADRAGHEETSNNPRRDRAEFVSSLEEAMKSLLTST